MFYFEIIGGFFVWFMISLLPLLYLLHIFTATEAKCSCIPIE